jgi:hypothetical protein
MIFECYLSKKLGRMEGWKVGNLPLFHSSKLFKAIDVTPYVLPKF